MRIIRAKNLVCEKNIFGSLPRRPHFSYLEWNISLNRLSIFRLVCFSSGIGLGVIHKPRGHIFGYFDPLPPSWSLLLNKAPLPSQLSTWFMNVPYKVSVADDGSRSFVVFNSLIATLLNIVIRIKNSIVRGEIEISEFAAVFANQPSNLANFQQFPRKWIF